MKKQETCEFHPIASVFPLLEGAELEELAADIRANGLHESGWTYKGKILDGRNRATACTMAGVKFKTRDFKGSHLDALAFAWSENFPRRHLNPGQAAACLELRKRRHAEFAAEIEKIRDSQPKGGRIAQIPKPGKKISPVSEDRESRKTSTRRAKAAGTNRRYLEAAEVEKMKGEAGRGPTPRGGK